jgi:hypothetical protein
MYINVRQAVFVVGIRGMLLKGKLSNVLALDAAIHHQDIQCVGMILAVGVHALALMLLAASRQRGEQKQGGNGEKKLLHIGYLL